MSRLTLVGRVSDSLGHAEHRSADGWRSYSALASIEYRSVQPAEIPVNLDHAGRDVGRALFLERTASGDIVAVAQVDDADHLLATRPGSLYFSPALRHRRGRDIEIVELSVTSDPATIGLPALELFGGDAHQAASYVRCRRKPALADLLERAALADRQRRLGDPILLAGAPSLTAQRLGPTEWHQERLHGGREQIVRHGGGVVLSVRR